MVATWWGKARWSICALVAAGAVLALSVSAAASPGITEFSTGLPPSSDPVGITPGPDGNVWFTEQSSPNVGRITPGGTITELPVSGATSLSAIATGSDGNLWATDLGGDQIFKITPAGTATPYAIPTPSSQPSHIVAGPDGNLWFTETSYSASNIGKITTGGVITEYPTPTAHAGPAGITVGPDGNLWFTEHSVDMIGRITPAGSITEFPRPGGSAGVQPYEIAAGPDGNLWFTEEYGSKIGRITTAGAITEFTIPTATSQPRGIAKGADGNLWFTEEYGNNIGTITTSGAISETPVPTPSSVPDEIALGSDGNLWFTETSGNKIGRVVAPSSAPGRTLTVSFAGAGSGIVSGSGLSCTATCSKSLPDGAVVSLTAAAAAGSTFTGWAGACSGAGGCTVTMSSDETVTASFAKASTRPRCSLTPKTNRVTLPKPKKTRGHTHPKERAGKLSLIATCDQAVTVTIKATITETLTARHHKRTKTFKLPTVHVSLSAAVAKAITVNVPSSLVNALEHSVKESAAFSLTGSDANGVAHATAKLLALEL